MNAVVCLLGYELLLLLIGPTVLTRLTRGGQAPRAGVAAWLIAIVSAVLTWLAVAALVVLDVIVHWGSPESSLVVSCLAVLCGLAAGQAGSGPQLAVLVAIAVAVAAIVIAGVRLLLTISRFRGRASRHREAIRLVGRRTVSRDVFVVEAAERAAYCVAGRPSTIVVTSSAVAALDDQELSAVIAHERAHLAGHHLTVMTLLRGLAAVLPHVTLISRGAQEVGRLLEMCADDAAARDHGHRALLDGLLALVAGAPAAALGAADVAVLQRAQRLATPTAHRVRLWSSAALASASTLIVLAPVAVVSLGAAGIWLCRG